MSLSSALVIVVLLPVFGKVILSVDAGKESCSIRLPQDDVSPDCRNKRQIELQMKQDIYKLKPIGRTFNSAFDNPVPLLNMSSSQFIDFTLKDPFTRYHLQLYGQGKDLMTQLFGSLPNVDKAIESLDDYKEINNHFVTNIEALGGTPYRIPSDHEPFQDVISKWKNDKVFAELRLAGVNPTALQRLSLTGTVGLKWSELIEKHLNPSFDFKKAVEEVLDNRLTFEKAVKKGCVFVLRYPLGDDISDVERDFMEPDVNRKVQPFNSPIALFVSKLGGKKGKEAQLLPVAIQADYTPSSRVDTPRDGDLWTLAKLNLQVTDMTYSQVVDHLVKVHLLLEPLCVVLQRRLSKVHPLHQLLKFHCRGITVTNNLGVPNLVGPGRSTDQLNAFGAKGSNELLLGAYAKFGWEQTDFEGNLKKRGVDNRKKLPYYPYREDGRVIYEAIREMVNEYVKLYYEKNQDVKEDTELQAFLNEVSANGVGPNGGLGKVKGFPAKITSRKELVDMVTRWISQGSLQHAAISYPLINYATFTPLGPSKLYSDARVNNIFGHHNFSNARISAVQAALGLVLSVFRYDSLFDYSGELEDPLAREVVYKHHCKLVKKIQPKLERRNKRRFHEGHLTYPYLLPRWLPNGVQT